jgi:hypothetical protein
MLDSPASSGKTLRWSGAVVPPYNAAFDKIGIELRTFLPAVAYNAMPTTGGYAEVDFMGAGIVRTGQWIEAFIQLWAQCRGGDVGQLIDCYGLHFVLAPAVEVWGLSMEQTSMADEQIKVISYMISPDIYLVETSHGWLYRAPAPGEYGGTWEPIDAYPTRGPFETPEEAARDAVATLGLRPRLPWSPMPTQPGLDGIGRAAAALHAAMSEL